eukprot:7420685-Prorocentrum_lima.AAC.1
MLRGRRRPGISCSRAWPGARSRGSTVGVLWWRGRSRCDAGWRPCRRWCGGLVAGRLRASH